ncbi:MAG: ribonuclease D [Actinomycetes bacterium]
MTSENTDDLSVDIATEEVQEVTSIKVAEPRDGLPKIATTAAELLAIVEAISQGTGPVALDAERASGFKFSQRAYLIQLRRDGSGSHLIDPTSFENLDVLQTALQDVDWILHAASQDLVCLAEVGLVPTAGLFDTELAGRLLGLPRVGLGPMIETQLGFALAKEHSAADWSTRPLPESWLNYAALDVEFLIELWSLLDQQLIAAGKRDWAVQEFDHVRRTTVPIERVDPWRRTSGMHVIRSPREIAIVREVWQARDEIAREQDIAAGRILSDSHIVTLASSGLTTKTDLRSLSFMHLRNVKRHADTWIQATIRAHELTEDQLPPVKLPVTGTPAPRNWEARNPEAWRRLEFTRAKLATTAEELNLPIENLMTPETIRRVLWSPPETPELLRAELEGFGARIWQIEIVAPVLETAIWFMVDNQVS